MTAPLLGYPRGGQLDGEFDVTLDIAFTQVETVEGQPVLAVLNQLSDLTLRIVMLFEKRLFR
jgi:hypothetical protein